MHQGFQSTESMRRYGLDLVVFYKSEKGVECMCENRYASACWKKKKFPKRFNSQILKMRQTKKCILVYCFQVVGCEEAVQRGPQVNEVIRIWKTSFYQFNVCMWQWKQQKSIHQFSLSASSLQYKRWRTPWTCLWSIRVHFETPKHQQLTMSNVKRNFPQVYEAVMWRVHENVPEIHPGSQEKS